MAVLFRVQAAIALSCLASLVSSSAVSTQYHAQDGIGQYTYGYSGGPSAKTETKTADGVVRGQYSYIDAHGLVQTASYVADPVHGFRVAATNDPSNGASAVHAPAAVAHVPVVAAHAPAVAAHAPAAAYHHGPIPGVHLPPGVDTPEVQIAKSAHYQAVAEAKARNAHASYGSYGYYPAGAAYVPYAAAHSHPGYYTQVKDTPEVQAAKSAHFAAVHEAKARAHAAIPYQDYYNNYAGGYYSYHVPVPVQDTAEVAAAKAAHFAAVHDAKARLSHAHTYSNAYHPYAGGYAAAYAPLPVKDTPEVAAAKAAHFAAVHEAKSRTLHAGAAYYPYAAAHSYYAAPHPVADTPEVAAAKAAHYAAVHEAKARNHYAAHAQGHYAAQGHYDAQGHYSYVPLPVTDTPEVAHAKAAHLAAVHHAKATHWW